MSQSEEYYNRRFRKHIRKWMEIAGVLDARVVDSPEFRFPAVLRDQIPEAWEHIPRADTPYFLSALTFTVLIDQVMYSHFRNFYPAFREITLYPKMWSYFHWNPFEILREDVLSGHGISQSEMENVHDQFSAFFVEDLKEFFDGRDDMPSWSSVSEAMQNDHDISDQHWGKYFVECLERPADD